MQIEKKFEMTSDQVRDLMIYYAMKSRNHEFGELYKIWIPDASSGEIARSAFLVRLALGIPEPFNGNY